MRYYKIVIGGANGQTWDSTNDPNALNVEMDVTVPSAHLPAGGSWVRLWGIPLELITQANNFNKQPISVYGGFAPGLPLATAAAAYAGLLFSGSILPAFGNWIGTDMTLDLICQAPLTPSQVPATQTVPAPIVHNWSKGQPLSQALTQTLQTAFPAFTPVVAISPSLVLPYTDTGFYKTIESYARYIHSISQSIMGDTTYPGVAMSVNGNNINVSDGTQPSAPTSILFQDLIGQPTWLGFNKVQVKTVMRADIINSSTVMLPQTVATVSATSGSAYRQSSGFSGSWLVTNVRHIGNFRQPDGASWVSVFDCVSQNSGAAAGDTP